MSGTLKEDRGMRSKLTYFVGVSVGLGILSLLILANFADLIDNLIAGLFVADFLLLYVIYKLKRIWRLENE